MHVQIHKVFSLKQSEVEIPKVIWHNSEGRSMLEQKKLQRQIDLNLNSLVVCHLIYVIFRQLLYLLDYKMHPTIRRTQVLEQENRKKTPLHCCPLPSEPGKLHSDYKIHPHFPPKLGGLCLIVRKIWYLNSLSLGFPICRMGTPSTILWSCED